MPITMRQKSKTMKKAILLFLLLFTLMLPAQIPVTDAATNASLGITNNQLMSIDLQLKTVNKNLLRLITLMENNNNNNEKAKEILKEELEAKKTAPEYVMKSTDVNRTIALKDKILEVYQSSKNSIQEFKYLERNEIQEFTSYTANTIIETQKLFKQCNEILNTRSIILPEERLKKVNGINTQLETLLDSLIAYNLRLSQLNAFRKTGQSLINLNKN